VAGVQLDGGKNGFTGRSSSGWGSISSSSNRGSGEKAIGKTSISSGAESSKLSRSLGPGSLSLESSEESSLGFSNLQGINNWGMDMDGSNWEGSMDMDRGNWKVVSGNTESEVISNIVDSVDSSLVSIGVRSSDASVGISLFLLGRVDVLVSVSNVAELILSLELGADWASDGGGSSISNWGSSISSWGSGISNWGSSISSWDSSNSWGISSSVLSSDNWGSSSKSRGSSNGASSEGSSIQGSNGSSICKPGINTVGNWCCVSSSIRGSITSIAVCTIVKTSTAKVLGGDWELSLSGSSSQKGRDDSLKWI